MTDPMGTLFQAHCTNEGPQRKTFRVLPLRPLHATQGPLFRTHCMNELS